MVLSRIATILSSPLPACGERSDRIARCDPGEGGLSASPERVESAPHPKPSRSYHRAALRADPLAPASTSPRKRGEARRPLQPELITLEVKASIGRNLLGSLGMRLITGVGNGLPRLSSDLQPKILDDTQLRYSLFWRTAMRRARFEVRSFRNPDCVLVGPIHNDSVLLHSRLSKVRPNYSVRIFSLVAPV
jgi:hypothetical protein